MTEGFTRSIRSIQADRARPVLIWISLACVLLIAWGAWFTLSTVSVYVVSVEADLEASERAHEVEAPLSGDIVRTNIALGQTVQAGNVLVELDSSEMRLELEEVQQRIASLDNELDALRAELRAERRSLEALRSTMPIRVAEAQAQHREALAMAQYATEHASQIARLAERGDATEVEHRLARAEAEQANEAAEARRLAIASIEAEIQLAEADRLARIEEIKREQERLVGQRAAERATVRSLDYALERRKLTAPVSGIIAETAPLRPGRVVSEGQWLVTILPESSPSRIVADFDASEAHGRLRAGQRARVRLDGFPWSQYGTMHAAVEHVAAEPRNGRVRAELELLPQTVPPGVSLQHGLPGIVEVEVERVSPAGLVLRAAGRRVRSDPSPDAQAMQSRANEHNTSPRTAATGGRR